MPKEDEQALETSQKYDRMISEIESIDPEMIYAVVPGSRLHQIINDPATKGKDEG